MTDFIHSAGVLLAGRYEVVSACVGGMGIVYLCTDRKEDGQPVALKTFKPQYLPNLFARDCFIDESSTWITLGRHPHIVQAHRVVYFGDRREVYIVLDWIPPPEGRRDASLMSWLRSEAPLHLEPALLLALHIARGMRHAATKIPGFVHSDLKPSNVLVGRDKSARVTDFGIATLEGSAADDSPAMEKASRPSIIVQQYSEASLYLAPEQWRQGAKPDVRADLYALGGILHQALTGKIAALGQSLPEMMQSCPGGPDENFMRRLEEGHLSGSEKAIPGDFPIAVRDLTSRFLAVNPEERFGSWHEAVEAIAEVYQGAVGRDAPEEETLHQESQSERVARGWSYQNLGTALFDLGKPDKALSFFRRALEVGEKESEAALKGAAMSGSGCAVAHLGDPRQGIEKLGSALTLARERGDRAGEGTVLSNLGGVYAAHGRPREATKLFGEALQIARKLGDRISEGTALGNLGNANAMAGKMVEAITFFNRHLALAREIQDRVGEGNSLSNLGAVYLDLGQPQRAIEFLRPALTIARSTGDRSGEAKVLANAGSAYFQLGDAERSKELFQRHLAITREIGDRLGEGAALRGLGTACSGLGRKEEAISCLAEALAIAGEVGDTRGQALCSFNLAVVLLASGLPDEASRHARLAVRLFSSDGNTAMTERVEALLSSIGKGNC